MTPGAFAGYNLLENKGLSYYYSLSNKFFDYMHAEVPCLTNDFPEYARINKVYKVAMYCELKPEIIAEKINALINDKTLYNELKMNCKRAKFEFNWQIEEKKLINIYQTIG